MSFCHYETICSVLQLPLESYLDARNGLIAKDLIAFDGTRFQALALPERPVGEAAARLRTPVDLADHDPATICSLIRRSLPLRS